VGIDWDGLRKQLGNEYGPGCWFCVSEESVVKQSGRRFANKPGDRRIVLATQPGPTAVIYPRSSSIPGGFPHDPHVHESGAKPCRIDKHGWVHFDVPVTVDAAALNQDTYSCSEPDGTGLPDELKKALKR